MPAGLHGAPAYLARTPRDLPGAPPDLVGTPAYLLDAPPDLVGAPAYLLGAPHDLLGAPHDLVGTPHDLLGAPHDLLGTPHDLLGPPAYLLGTRLYSGGVPPFSGGAPHYLVGDPLFSGGARIYLGRTRITESEKLPMRRRAVDRVCRWGAGLGQGASHTEYPLLARVARHRGKLMDSSAASGLAAFGLVGTLFMFLLAILWLLVPFAIFGIKPLLRTLIAEQRKTQELLSAFSKSPLS